MKLRPFELALLIVFGVLGIVALVILSAYKPPPDETNSVRVSSVVEIWGTLPADEFNSVLARFSESVEAFKAVEYTAIDPRNFDFELINAIAERRNPDLILIPHTKIIEHRNKIYPVPYESYPLRDFRSSYIDGAQLVALQDGIYGFPIMVDPLVMYWNRDLFASVGFINPPVTWEQIVGETAPALVERDFNRTILRSPIAFGTYQNVNNAFSVLSMLLLQAGSQMVSETNRGYRVSMNDSTTDSEAVPLNDVLSFYTRFGSISNPLYSWNRTLPEDTQMFIAEDLALYFGKGSEARELEELNPNLNFDIAEVPNAETAEVRRTYGDFYVLAPLKESGSLNDAYTVMSLIGSSQVATAMAEAYDMAPTHRSTLAAGSDDLYGRVIYSAAQVSRGWLNPDKEEVDIILNEIISDINSNRISVSVATGRTNTRIGQALDE